MGKPLCVYCARRPGKTKDHVPPKCLFLRPRPSNLVSVPCCEKCRRAQSADDEYFKNVIGLRRDVSEQPALKPIVESVHRALARPQHARFTTALLQSTDDVEIRSLAGLYLGRGVIYKVETQRLNTVVRRTMLGLYFHEVGQRLPDAHSGVVWSAEAMSGLDKVRRSTFERVVEQALAGRRKTFGDQVFTYWFQRLPSEPRCTLWAFFVYGRVPFIGFTVPSRSLQPARGPQ
jgi:hypothetical protein